DGDTRRRSQGPTSAGSLPTAGRPCCAKVEDAFAPDAMPALLTDLYQLTMMQAYLEEGMADTSVFELFVRKLPPERNFLVAAGLEQALDFLERLRDFRFEGDVDAMPEGTMFFPDEPIL